MERGTWVFFKNWKIGLSEGKKMSREEGFLTTIYPVQYKHPAVVLGF